jgi:hypothetical protein
MPRPDARSNAGVVAKPEIDCSNAEKVAARMVLATNARIGLHRLVRQNTLGQSDSGKEKPHSRSCGVLG